MSGQRNETQDNPPSGSGGAARGEEDAISRNLKRAYDQVANEPLPDTLSSLLEKLKRGE